MQITRKFLGLEQPALLLAADELLGQFRQGNEADLRRALVVVPGGRAGRRLLEILVDRSAALNLRLTPPEIVTVGRLPELLYPGQKPLADDLVQQLAWAEALKNFDRAKLTRVISQLPDDGDPERWLDLGRMLQSLHRELASDGLDFSDVADRGRQLERFSESDRWRIFAELQQAYLRMLDALELWDRQTARLFAIDHRECRLDRPLFLIAAVDLNRCMRQMLDQVADRVTAFVYAPQQWRDRFDSHGCLIPEKWESVEIPLSDQDLLVAEDPLHQAELAVRQIASYAGCYRAEDLTIGLPDERIVPQLVRQFDECGLPNRFGPGDPLTQSSVVRMLRDLATWLESGRYSHFAALIRHPDIEAWLLQRGLQPGWIEQLDNYYNDHLPVQIDSKWLGKQEHVGLAQQVQSCLFELAGRLGGDARPLDHWLSPIGQVVFDVYGGRGFDLEDAADRVKWKACHAVQESLSVLANVPPSLMPRVTATEALRMLLDQFRSQRIAPAATESAIELVGWLELPLDDAPAVIVTTFNEGFVPSNLNADLFLPGGLRTALGLDDNARRYARDAYAVSTLLVPWRKATFIVARRTADNDPLAPSRLLFAVPKDTVARRAMKFFEETRQQKVRPPIVGGLKAGQTDLVFAPPPPDSSVAAVTSMSVTSFSAYLACPYRFYLTRILKLDRSDDDATELDGAAFGNLAHGALEEFGVSHQRDSCDADTIRDVLYSSLARIVLRRFGKHPGAAVSIQVEQLKLRLRAFANWQAQRRQQGWRIEHAELSFSDTPGELVVDGQPMLLTGRIDRIDLNEHTGRRQILDYKTSDAGDHPEKTHRKRNGDWVDLQLPLYRHLARRKIDSPAELGYIILPKNTARVGLALAGWTDADFKAADDVAHAVVRNVRRAVFWPPKDPPPPYSEDLAYICMDRVFGKHCTEASTGHADGAGLAR